MPRHSTPANRLRSTLAGHVLNVAALIGALCALLTILAITMNISIVLFRTGSMSPAIPVGSAALVKEIPATEVALGDVVTVERGADELPVTHRVIEILGTDATTGEVRFRMQGDANAEPDTEAYSATEVRRVLGSVPGIAPAIAALGTPRALGSITLAAAALVLWAFWPRGDHGEREARDIPAARGNRARLPTALGVLALTALVQAGPGSAAAHAATAPGELIEGDYLRLETIETPAMTDLAPGASATWTVGVWADAPEPGEIDVIAQVTDAPRSGEFSAEVTSCDRPWRGGECAGEETLIAGDLDLADLAGTDGDGLPLETFPADSLRWFRFDVTLERTAAQEASVDLTVVAHGFGEEVASDGGGDDLVSTGTGPAGPIAAAAFLALGLVALLARGRLLRRSTREVR